MYTTRKGCTTILIGWIFYGQGMKQINSCLIEGINYHITIILTTLVGNVFFPDILKEFSSAEQLQAFHFLKMN